MGKPSEPHVAMWSLATAVGADDGTGAGAGAGGWWLLCGGAAGGWWLVSMLCTWWCARGDWYANEARDCSAGIARAVPVCTSINAWWRGCARGRDLWDEPAGHTDSTGIARALLACTAFTPGGAAVRPTALLRCI